MHPAVLEAKAIAIVESVLEGGRAEDDLVELKAEWPDPRTWARQLAGLANRAAGPEIVIIVGIDEDAHALRAAGAIDVQEWWPTLRSRFDDDTPPELGRHLSVHLPNGRTVYALAFETDRAPYVLKSADGKPPHLEVPMRSGTSTRSAKRSELLRILAPRIATPTISPLYASANIEWHAKSERQVERISIFVQTDIFIEHIDSKFAMIPYHTMRAHLQVGDLRIVVKSDGYTGSSDSAGSTFGVEVRTDGILATGPGQANLRLHGTAALDALAEIEASSEARLTFEMPVLGSMTPARLNVALERDRSRDRDFVTQRTLGIYTMMRA